MSARRQGGETLIDFRQLFVDEEPPREGHLLCSSKIESTLRHKATLLDTVISALRQLGLARDEELRVRLCLDEAVTNAIRHGNRHDPSRMVTAELWSRPDGWCVLISDEGDGFSVTDIPDPDDPAGLLRENGRGLLLMHEFMDEVRIHAGGRCISLTRNLPLPETTTDDAGATPGGATQRCFELHDDPRGLVLLPGGLTPLDDQACQFGEQEVPEVCRRGAGRLVVLDLQGVPLLNDSGIGLLLNLRRELEKQGGRLALAGASELVQQILTATRLMPRVFPSHATVDEALSKA